LFKGVIEIMKKTFPKPPITFIYSKDINMENVNKCHKSIV